MRLVVITAVVGLAVAGCGGGSPAGGGAPAGGGTTASGASTSGTTVAPEGPAALFRYRCGACHSLGMPSSRSQQGGDVASYRLGAGDELAYAREMPRLHGPVPAAQLREIVAYVEAVQRRARGGGRPGSRPPN